MIPTIIFTALQIVVLLCTVYELVLILRIIFDWVQMLSRGWTPKGILLVIANVIYALTDPPLNWLRRRVPPLQIGAVALDLGFILLFIGVGILARIVTALAYSSMFVS